MNFSKTELRGKIYKIIDYKYTNLTSRFLMFGVLLVLMASSLTNSKTLAKLRYSITRNDTKLFTMEI